MEKLDLSVVIITRDDEHRVTKLVAYLVGIVSEVVVLIDNRDEEGTLSSLMGIKGCVAASFEFEGFGAAKQKAVSMAKHPWILSLDSDEMLDDACLLAIGKVDFTKPAVYRFRRLNHYNDRPIKACGWYPDHVKRLFHRSVAGFSEDVVHESVQFHGVEEEIALLDGNILHYSFYGSHELLSKVLTYTTMYADHYNGKPKSVVVILMRTVFGFIKPYILRRGIFYGRDGFIISLMHAAGVFHKHWRASEKAREKSGVKG